MNEEKISRNSILSDIKDGELSIDSLIRELRSLMNDGKPVINIYAAAKNKFSELEEFFYNNELTFYANNILSDYIIRYFAFKLAEAKDIISKIDETTCTKKYALASKISSDACRKMVSSDTEKYRSICLLIKNFSIEKDYKDVLDTVLFNGSIFVDDAYTYSTILTCIKIELIMLGMRDFASTIEDTYRAKANELAAIVAELNEKSASAQLVNKSSKVNA